MIKKVLIKKLEGQVAVAATDLAIFLDKPQGVAEHIDYVVTAEKKLEELSSAKGKLELLKKL